MGADQSPNTKSEIDEIMNEIQNLQKGMAQAAAAPPAASAQVSTPVANDPGSPSVQKNDTPAPVASSALTPATAPAVMVDDNAFTDASLEETLAEIKSETASGGAFDEPSAPVESIVPTMASVTPDQAAEDAFDEALLETEAERIAEEISQEQIEELKMTSPVRLTTLDHLSNQQSPDEGSLTISLKGSMTLKLKYEYEGQDVVVGFENGCLNVRLSNGTEFKIPVGTTQSYSKAA